MGMFFSCTSTFPEKFTTNISQQIWFELWLEMTVHEAHLSFTLPSLIELVYPKRTHQSIILALNLIPTPQLFLILLTNQNVIPVLSLT